ncbi:hypothetical protein DFH28DRAFT_1155480 [Melampsora americana]|nr:hypothetical protein DFH28DRAFT_1155480 [Melampsora americana]
MAPRYKPGAATAANLKAANKARLDDSKSLQAPSSSLQSPSPSASRSLRPRSPQGQGTRTSPGFVSQPRDSRRAVPSPLRLSSSSQNHVDSLNDKSDKRDEPSPEPDEDSSSSGSTASRSGGKRKKNKHKKRAGKSKKQRIEVPKALVQLIENDSDIEMIPNPKPKKPGQAKQTAESTNELFSYYGDPVWDPANPDDSERKLYPCLWCGKDYRDGTTNHFNLKGHRDGAPGRKPCRSRDKAISAGVQLPPTYQEGVEAAKKAAEAAKGPKGSLLDDLEEAPSEYNPDPCVDHTDSEPEDDDNERASIEATEITIGDFFSKAIHKCAKVNKTISRNGPLMQLFRALSKEESYTGPGLIAAHGQRWNIFLDMLERFVKAKKIVNRMLNEDENNQFDGTLFSPEEWKAIEALITVLRVAEECEPTSPTSSNIFKERNIFASQNVAELPGDAELQAYLSGKYMCDDNQDILDWWARTLLESVQEDSEERITGQLRGCRIQHLRVSLLSIFSYHRLYSPSPVLNSSSL